MIDFIFGGKPDFIPPDDTLNRVASILGATCQGQSVSLGGDAVVTVDSEVLSDGDWCIGDGDFELMSVDNEMDHRGITTPLCCCDNT